MSDLNIRARGLLDFALQSVEEGLKEPSTKNECFAEADHAIGILKKMLLKEDEFQMARLALLGIFDASFGHILESEQGAQDRFLKDALEKMAFAKTLFEAGCD
jgi:hypothetical protein